MKVKYGTIRLELTKDEYYKLYTAVKKDRDRDKYDDWYDDLWEHLPDPEYL